MTIEADLFTLLSSGTDAGSRVYPLVAPDSPVKPYLVYQRIFGNSENLMRGQAGIINTRFQIDCYADTFLAARVLFNQVDTKFSGWAIQNVSISNLDLYEQDVKLYRVTADYSVWHT